VNPLSLAGKTAMVTGASRGISLGLAKALADSGANLILDVIFVDYQDYH